MNTLKVTGVNQAGSQQVAVRCPGCGQLGVFVPIGQDLQISTQPLIVAGLRMCPNQACRGLLFFVSSQGQIVSTFPSVRIDFDPTGVPQKVLSPLEEVITCHANECYVASAIMVRKTLESICEDKGATGKDLKARIAALGSKILIPKELIDGMEVLRLLGNDAAHFESKVFDQVGKDEVEVAVEFTKEILKAVYQYSSLIAKLTALQKKP